MALSAAVMAVVAVLAVILGLGVLAGWRMRRFLAQTPALPSPEDLKHYRRLIAWDMYMALAMIALVVVAAIVLAASLYQGWLSRVEVLILLMPGGVILGTVRTLWTKPAEARVKEIPVSDEALREERDRLVKIWGSKPFPDW
jgi:hypothetical protein